MILMYDLQRKISIRNAFAPLFIWSICTKLFYLIMLSFGVVISYYLICLGQ